MGGRAPTRMSLGTDAPTTLCPLQIHAAALGIRVWVQALKSLPHVLGMQLGLGPCTGEPWGLAEPGGRLSWDVQGYAAPFPQIHPPGS